ncbi:hypothetical protein PF005_g9624 [Phytophthora fragariae]|nr:hypothetical protein PF009_g10673 [Phytophthora fragariae]KAE9006422.1 hypothetical protein PF011_g11594 [Phytophthora fragariae]KAE9107611.1 hypothetical protein PF010_g12210 [Phytophthora fragariae]KAE9214962.1 hypothetical protein PF005_g9624 [Phytophthora fragariae]KAE9223069.1 hypothetical protein PF002_g15072 [Phytophthora fragariae]
MLIKLALKGLLAHVDIVEPESEITGGLTNYAKALNPIAKRVELQH